MNFTEPITILSSKHELTRVEDDPKGYGDGLSDTFRCACGWECDAHDVEGALGHGWAVGYRLGRTEERATIVGRAAREVRKQLTAGTMVPSVDLYAIAVPSPESQAELDAYRTGPLSPKRGRATPDPKTGLYGDGKHEPALCHGNAGLCQCPCAYCDGQHTPSAKYPAKEQS